LHAIASRTDQGLRAADLHVLNDAIRTLEAAKREYLASDRRADALRIDQLLARVVVIRDRVGADYVPTPANAPGGREIPVERSAATEELSGLCVDLAEQAHLGGSFGRWDLVKARRAVGVLEREVVGSC
jgi:hypothetical protein